MSVLQREDPDTDRAETSGAGPGVTLTRVGELLTAALSGVLCVLLGVVVTAIPTLLAWVSDERSTLSLWQTLGVSVDIWALAHRAQVDTPAFGLVLAPLLLTVVLVAICWYAARHILLGRTELEDERGPRSWYDAWRAIGGPDALAFVLGYLIAALVVAHTASFGVAPVVLPTLTPGALLIPLSALLLIWWAEYRSAERRPIDQALAWLSERMPAVLRRSVGPAIEVLLGLAALCFLLVLGIVLLRGERILTLFGALDAGLVGTGVLSLAQLAALPNLMVWALGWLTGAGMQIGSVHVGWSEATPGDLPLLPVLGALPEPGALPPGLWAGVLVPVLAGAWLGHRCASAAPRLETWLHKTLIMTTGAGLVSLVVVILAWLASGSMTPGLLGTIGVIPWQVALLLLAQLVAGGLVMVTIRHLLGRRL